jgi:glucokinase
MKARRGAVRGQRVIIAGDVGGTNTRLVMLSIEGKPIFRAVLESRRFPSLEVAVRTFVEGAPPSVVVSAAFGIAGPVIDGRCKATNLPWVIDEKVMARSLGIPRVTLMNDLVAIACGVVAVPRSRVRRLGGGGSPRPRGATIAVIAAGTGLGEALLVWTGTRFVPCATEGGHADFAPRTELEMELLRYLAGRFGHVSYERVLSGDGIGALYDFFREVKRVPEKRASAQTIEAAADRNVAIAKLGVVGESVAAARAIELFAKIYGAEAGNLALKSLAEGGVYLCGSIAVALLPVLAQKAFRTSFSDKGRLKTFLDRVPLAVVLDTDVGLAGAARVALEPPTL